MNWGINLKKTADNKKCLAESWDIIAQRCQFLREIRQYRTQCRKIVYLDETWVNAHHGRSSQWFDEKGASSRVPPAGKGQRLIILHVRSAHRGFLPGCKLVFRGSKGSEHYHQEMNGECFNDWFEHKLLPVLDNPSVIVLDNATHHNVRVPGTESPTTAWRKPRIIEWLQHRNIAFEPTMLKPEVYAIAKRHKPPIQYLTDQLANAQGHVVLRTLVRYWIFNPIEMIWAQVKGYIATKNKTFKLADVVKLMPDAFDSVSLENWKSAVRQVIETEDTYWAADGLQYSQVDPVVITFSTQDDSDSSGNKDDSVLESSSDDGEDTDTNVDDTDEEEGGGGERLN